MSYKIGFTCSSFDLLHPGHVAMLRDCSSMCDVLVVGLHTDPSLDRPSKKKPVQTVYERYLQLEGCKYVDKIIPYETESDLINLLAIERIHIRFAGEEYYDRYITGQDICEKRGIEIIYNNVYHGYSSAELRSRMT